MQEEKTHEEEEEQSFQRILTAFKDYEKAMFYWLRNKERQYVVLPSNHFLRIFSNNHSENAASDFTKPPNVISALRDRIRQNYTFLRNLCLPYHNLFPHLQLSSPHQSEDDTNNNKNSNNKVNSPEQHVNTNEHSHDVEADMNNLADIEKVKSTLRILVRDWSADGVEERLQCYQPILDELERRFRLKDEEMIASFSEEERKAELVKQRNHIRVLTPGTGLSRLTWEIANKGMLLVMIYLIYYIINMKMIIIII